MKHNLFAMRWLELASRDSSDTVTNHYARLTKPQQIIVAAYLRLGDAEAPDAPWVYQQRWGNSLRIVSGRESDRLAGLVPLKPTIKSERKNQERELKEAQEAYRKDARDERLVDNLRRVFG